MHWQLILYLLFGFALGVGVSRIANIPSRLLAVAGVLVLNLFYLDDFTADVAKTVLDTGLILLGAAFGFWHGWAHRRRVFRFGLAGVGFAAILLAVSLVAGLWQVEALIPYAASAAKAAAAGGTWLTAHAELIYDIFVVFVLVVFFWGFYESLPSVQRDRWQREEHKKWLERQAQRAQR